MKWLDVFICIVYSAGFRSSSYAQEQWPLHDNGINEVVQWYGQWPFSTHATAYNTPRDHYSYIVNGQRLVVWSGEFHPWRIPVPELWIDVLEKIQSAGFNTIALYELWGWHAPNNETLDFSTGAHDYARLFDEAKRAGVYILYRPGPYTNAEANGGGFPGWLTTGEYGSLRNDDPRYTAAWERYSGKVADFVRPHLVTNGGNVIMWQLENEYGMQWLDPDKRIPNDTAINYMELLEQNIDLGVSTFRSQRIIPTFGQGHGPRTIAMQAATLMFNGAPETYTVFDYVTHFQEVSPTQPSFLPEFQGGSYNPWIGPAEGCRNNTGPTFVNLFYRHNLAQKVSAMNVYMAYGGTNWGNIGYPLAGTSYDYSAPVQENRLIAEKHSETKLFGLFLRIARDFTKMDRIGNSTDYTTNEAVTATELRNPDTNGAFYVTRHDHSPSTELSRFRLHVKTSVGELTIPRNHHITLNGVQSKVVATDFSIGSSGKKLVYSTAEVLTVADLGDRQVIVLWAPRGETGEVMLEGSKDWTVVSGTPSAVEKFHDYSTSTDSVVLFTVQSEPLVLDSDNGVQMVIVDRETAYGFWAPNLDSDPMAWENSTVLVYGPYLVRGVNVAEDTLNIRADWNASIAIEIWASNQVSKIAVNGVQYQATRTPYGSLICHLPASETTESVQSSLPSLLVWKVADSFPERRKEYDDSRWTDADHMWTPHPVPPATYPVLFADEYGYQAGNLLWRGRFEADETEGPAAVHLRVIGGAGSGYAAYLNGNFLGAYLGNHTVRDGNMTFTFQDDTINTGDENVLLVIQDTMGKDQRDGALDPRGILNATLISSAGNSLNFTSWKVAGNAGGNHLIDPIRGSWNEGGLHAERLGWHLPGFDDSQWEPGHPKNGFSDSGVQFYRTNLPLDLPKDHDVSIAFELLTDGRAKLRAQLYVNGYQFGKIIPWFGNQIEFPVFPGILDYHGDNTIGLSVWSMSEELAAVDVKVKALGVHRSALDLSFDSEYLRPGWSDRSQYA